jgi:hypothetical protein
MRFSKYRFSARLTGFGFTRLAAVYRTYKEGKDLGISKRMARHIARYCKAAGSKGTSPVRTSIDATLPSTTFVGNFLVATRLKKKAARKGGFLETS